MRNWLTGIVSFLLIILILLAGRMIYFRSGGYIPPDRPLKESSIDKVTESAPHIKAVDNPVVSEGVVVIDYAHDNAFLIEELNTLLSKVVARGLSYELLLNPLDPANVDLNLSGQGLLDKLPYAKTLILATPRVEYTAAEILAIERFVENGGRLLTLGDPTRIINVEALNSIAGSFGVIYANDYLYSLDNNDNNYRNVIYTDFKRSPLTKGLNKDSKIIFYSGSSVNAPGYEIIMGGETVNSSTSEGGRDMSPAVLTTDGQVLALGDLTFFSEPHSSVENNGIFINNIADFIAGGQRNFELKDFPNFLSSKVDIVFDDPLVFNSQFQDSVLLKDFLEGIERNVSFTNQITDTSNDVIFIGRFDDSKAVAKYLDKAGISILDPKLKPKVKQKPSVAGASARGKSDKVKVKAKVQITATPDPNRDEPFVDGRIQIEGVGELERGGSTLFYLHQEAKRNILIMLSDNPTTNADAFTMLLGNTLTGCLASPVIAVCQTGKPGKKLLPSLRSARIDKILVVSDDNARVRADEQTSALAYNNILSATYKVDIWVTSEDGSPNIDTLTEYDAVIWTTGDYWDDSIELDDTILLTDYIKQGGNLIMSGSSIAFDWDHTPFLTDIVHANYVGFSEQLDMKLVLPDHPIADNFTEEDIISFGDTPSGEKLEPDAVSHTVNARVIFQRGADSKDEGAASVIVYEDDRSKIAYFAFPIYMLPTEAQSLLVENTVDWFTKKVLALPDEADYTPYQLDGGDGGNVIDITPTPAPADGKQDSTGKGGKDSGGNGKK